MNTTLDANRLTKLHELDTLLPREIRGQSHVLPRIVSAVRRGELGRNDDVPLVLAVLGRHGVSYSHLTLPPNRAGA